MSHFPVDHPLRGLYRGLAVLVGLALVVFGVVGYVQTSDLPMFDQTGERALGLTTNLAFSLLSIVFGILVVATTLIGRNFDVPVNVGLGTVFMVAGLAMLCLIRTDLNFLAFSITNVNVSFVIGMLLMAAGLYGKASSRQRPRAAAPKQKADAAR